MYEKARTSELQHARSSVRDAGLAALNGFELFETVGAYGFIIVGNPPNVSTVPRTTP